MGVIYKEDLPRLLTDLKDLESKIKKMVKWNVKVILDGQQNIDKIVMI
jgi:hypothetical protein